MADRTHGGNHAPLRAGEWLDPGFCAGCDAERAGKALGAFVHVTHVAADSEEYARIWNEGYEEAVAQGLADDPTLAGDWLARVRAEAEAAGAAKVRARVEALADEWQANYEKWANVGPDAPKVAILRVHANRLRAALTESDPT